MTIPSAPRREAVVCLAAGPAQVPVLRTARERGLAVIGVDRDPDAPGWDLCDERLVHSTHEPEPVLAALGRIAERFRIVGVLNRSSGPPTVTAAHIARSFGLPGPSPRSARAILNKAELLPACRARGIAAADSLSASRLDGIDPERLGWPVVVKPALAPGGRRGVRVVASQTELEAAFAEARAHSLDGRVNVEQHVPGRDLSMLAVVSRRRPRVLALLDEINRVDRCGRVHPHAMAVPSVFERTPEADAAVDLAGRLVDLFELDRTPLLLSCRVEPGRAPRLIELQLDIGGDLVLDRLLPAATSFDTLGRMVDLLTGREDHASGEELRPAAVLYGNGETGPRIVQAPDREALAEEIRVGREELAVV